MELHGGKGNVNQVASFPSGLMAQDRKEGNGFFALALCPRKYKAPDLELNQSLGLGFELRHSNGVRLSQTRSQNNIQIRK